MTIEEAIRILALETSREALLPYAYDNHHRHKIVEEACRVAVAELRKRQWISVKDRLPKPEEEVIVFVVHENGCKIITTGMHEDGNVAIDDSLWSWNDIDFDYDKENDVYLIPHGWWEWNHYNPDNIYVESIDGEVTHWMPLPEPPKEA